MKGKQTSSRAGRIAVIVIGVMCLALCAWWVLAYQKTPEQRPRFLFAPVKRGNLEMIVSSTGTLAAVETVEIGTQVSGTIETLLVDYNDTVEKGQVLAELDQSLFKAAVDSASAGVLKAQAELKQAHVELQRNEPLYEKGYISEQEFLPYRTEVDTLKASLLSAEAALQQARINLENTVISSPIDGTVIDRSVDAGQTVAASLSTPTLFLVAKDLSRMQIETNVDETDIGQIEKGQSVRFTVQSYADRSFTGNVRQIRMQPETIDNVVTYTVIVAADNEAGLLLPGMTATVDFIVHDVTDALLVPVAAVQFTPDRGTDRGIDGKRDGDSRVFCEDNDDRLRAVWITAAQSDGIETVVAGADLMEGMRVAVGFAENTAGAERGSGFSLSSLIGQTMGGGGGPGSRPRQAEGQGRRP